MSNESLFSKIWRDPVFSKVIAEGIKYIISAALVGTLYLTVTDKLGVLGRILLLPVPIGLVFLVLIVSVMLYRYIQSKRDPILKEIYSPNYNFKELYDILYSRFLPENTSERRAREMSVPLDNLLILFYDTSVYLGKGISINYPGVDIDGNYAWSVLYPKLMSYSLVYKKENDKLYGSERELSITYHYSTQGIKFFQLLEKYFLKYPDAFDKAKRNKTNLDS